MSRALPPLDMHAHVDPSIAPRDLEGLGAVVFVATRSIDEYEQVRSRNDAVTLWGLGCHPGVAAAQATYDEHRFSDLLLTTPFVSEVGLDGSSGVPLDRQAEVLASILAQVAQSRRIVSLHTKGATGRTLDLLESSGVEMAILHWWLGSGVQTQRAIELGCLFSVNRSVDVRQLKAAGVQLTSILPETDHPSGNRRGTDPRQPGWTVDVERVVAAEYGTSADAVRVQFWETLTGLVDRCGVVDEMPPVVGAMISQVRAAR